MSNFSIVLKSLRKSYNLTQTQFAAEFNVTQTTINYWENEKREPNLDTLIKLAEYFNVTLDYLITGKPFISKKTDCTKKVFTSIQNVPKIIHKNTEREKLYQLLETVPDNKIPYIIGYVQGLSTNDFYNNPVQGTDPSVLNTIDGTGKKSDAV